MNLLRAYLVEGRSVRDLAADDDSTEPRVRASLASAGVRIEPGAQRGSVCSAVAWLGFGSFAEFVRRRGTNTLKCQAATLGVQVAALQRVYDIFRQLAVAEAKTHDDSESQRA